MLLAVLVGTVPLPLLAYVIGGRLVGPYLGTRGLGSFLEAIYTDAASGGLLALCLLLGPAACVGIWGLRSALLSAMYRADED